VGYFELVTGLLSLEESAGSSLANEREDHGSNPRPKGGSENWLMRETLVGNRRSAWSDDDVSILEWCLKWRRESMVGAVKMSSAWTMHCFAKGIYYAIVTHGVLRASIAKEALEVAC